MKKALVFFLSTYLFFLFFTKLVGFYIADLYFANAKTLTEKGNLQIAKAEIDKAITLNQNEAAYLRQRIKIEVAELFLDRVDNDLKEDIYTDLETAKKLNERNLATHRNIIPFYYYLGYLGTSVDMDNVTAYYKSLKNLYVNDLGMLVDIAAYEKKLNMTEDYALSLDLIKKIRPEVVDWHPAFK